MWKQFPLMATPSAGLLLWPPVLLCLTVLDLGVDGACQGPSTPEELFANITTGYRRRQRPHEDGPPVDVEVELYVTSLTTINQKEQKLGVAGYFRVWWTDPRLKFKNESEGGCLDTILLSQEERGKIWQPDLYFDNVLEEEHGADLYSLQSSGAVWKSQRLSATYECKMQFSKIPFDTQYCDIVVGSYSEEASEVRISPREGDKGLTLPSEFPEISVWEVAAVHSKVETPQLPSGVYTYVHLQITLQRRPDYYVRGIVLKAVLFVVISWCSFFVNRTVAPARVAIGVIPVLIMMNLLNSVDALLPPISYTTFLTNFLISCLCFTSTSVFEYAVVAHLLQTETWYAEKCAVLMHLSHSDLKRPNSEPHHLAPLEPPPGHDHDHSEKDGHHSTHTTRMRFWSSNDSPGITAPAKLFRDHPVIRDIFAEFDRRHSGSFSAKEMRNTLRRFGQYRSLREVREIFEKLGVVEGENMTLSHFEEFLADPNTYIPVTPTKRSFWDMPPSLQIDIIMRFGYPVAFTVVSLLTLTSLAPAGA